MFPLYGLLKRSKFHHVFFFPLILITACLLTFGCGGAGSEQDDIEDSDDRGHFPNRALTSLSVSGANTVNENDISDYTVTATFSDGTSQVVTDMVIWSEDSPYVSMDTHGVLTVLEITGNHIVTISASYTYQVDTKTATRAVTIVDVPDGSQVSSHEGRFTTYEGTKTCLICHEDQAHEVYSSVHYQWKGDSRDVIGLNSEGVGKLGGINDFCIYPDINWLGKMVTLDSVEVDGGCARCHIGLGERPDSLVSQTQLENIDCLICHSDSYRRKVEKVDDTFRFKPDTEGMQVSILQAALDLKLPSSDNCLNCHANAGGGNNFKRGDLEEAHRNPSREFDVHLASVSNGGAGMNCLSCHIAQNHRIAGRGSDLRPRDSSEKVGCTICHSSAPHHNLDVDKHTKRVYCTVCHIPTFAKAAPTDMARDWSKPGRIDETKKLYEPYKVMQSEVIPEYRFFNGRSHFYCFGDSAIPGENGRIAMSSPDGDINDPNARIYAFKHHLGTQPIDPVTKKILPLKIGIFFQSGELDTAVREGVEAVGWAYSGYEFALTESYLGIFHEVAPKEEALSCSDCHSGGGRLNFAALGYTPNADYRGKPLCESCHEDESDEWEDDELFAKVHKEHVKDKKYDCSVCHTFSAAK